MNQFIESLKRLYQGGKLQEEKIIKLFESDKISEKEKMYILEVSLSVE